MGWIGRVLRCPDNFSFRDLFRVLDNISLFLIGDFWTAFLWSSLGRFLLASGDVRGFPLSNFLPSLVIFFLNSELGAVSLEVAVFLTVPAFERQVLII